MAAIFLTLRYHATLTSSSRCIVQEFKHISIQETLAKLQQKQVVIVDIRDEHSFQQGHIEGAFHLTNGTLNQFMQGYDFEQPVVVVCYHGNSSQGAAQYLVQQGFEEVYSMDGGFEGWRTQLPFVTSQD